MVAMYTRDDSAPPTPVAAYLRARLADTAYAQSNALDEILAGDDSFAWAHLSKARVNRSQGRLADALASFELALVNDPKLQEARRERAEVLVDLGRFEEAAVDYAAYLRRGSNLDPEAARGYLEVLIYRIGRLDEALEYLNLLQANGVNNAELRMHRAAIDWRGGRPQQAVEGYLGVLRERPDTARAALNIGLLYYEVIPQNDADRQLYWPRARAAFQLFLAHSEPTDGHEQFERTWGVPFRLHRIDELLGAGAAALPTLDALTWPGGA